MSKEAVIIQEFNEKERKYEYFVKGFNVTESIKILLKRHKEEYDKEKNIFAGTQGFIEAQQLYEKQISDLEAKLAESEKHRKKAYQEGLLQKQFDKDVEIMQLKQQLTEKEKDIAELEEQDGVYHNQLAIEQLEKVKEFLFEQNIEITRLNKISDFIDNQIKQLKEGK